MRAVAKRWEGDEGRTGGGTDSHPPPGGGGGGHDTPFKRRPGGGGGCPVGSAWRWSKDVLPRDYHFLVGVRSFT